MRRVKDFLRHLLGTRNLTDHSVRQTDEADQGDEEEILQTLRESDQLLIRLAANSSPHLSESMVANSLLIPKTPNFGLVNSRDGAFGSKPDSKENTINYSRVNTTVEKTISKDSDHQISAEVNIINSKKEKSSSDDKMMVTTHSNWLHSNPLTFATKVNRSPIVVRKSDFGQTVRPRPRNHVHPRTKSSDSGARVGHAFSSTRDQTSAEFNISHSHASPLSKPRDSVKNIMSLDEEPLISEVVHERIESGSVIGMDFTKMPLPVTTLFIHSMQTQTSPVSLSDYEIHHQSNFFAPVFLPPVKTSQMLDTTHLCSIKNPSEICQIEKKSSTTSRSGLERKLRFTFPSRIITHTSKSVYFNKEKDSKEPDDTNCEKNMFLSMPDLSSHDWEAVVEETKRNSHDSLAQPADALRKLTSMTTFAPPIEGNNSKSNSASEGNNQMAQFSVSVNPYPNMEPHFYNSNSSITDSLGFPTPELKSQIIPPPCPCHPLDQIVKNKLNAQRTTVLDKDLADAQCPSRGCTFLSKSVSVRTLASIAAQDMFRTMLESRRHSVENAPSTPQEKVEAPKAKTVDTQTCISNENILVNKTCVQVQTTNSLTSLISFPAERLQCQSERYSPRDFTQKSDKSNHTEKENQTSGILKVMVSAATSNDEIENKALSLSKDLVSSKTPKEDTTSYSSTDLNPTDSGHSSGGDTFSRQNPEAEKDLERADNVPFSTDCSSKTPFRDAEKRDDATFVVNNMEYKTSTPMKRSPELREICREAISSRQNKKSEARQISNNSSCKKYTQLKTAAQDNQVKSIWINPDTTHSFPSSKSIIDISGEGFISSGDVDLSMLVGDLQQINRKENNYVDEMCNKGTVKDGMCLGLGISSTNAVHTDGLPDVPLQFDVNAAWTKRPLMNKGNRGAQARFRAPFSYRSRKLSTLPNINTAMFECAVCSDYLAPPVRQCSAGHGLCPKCIKKGDLCPMCGKAIPTTISRGINLLVRTVLFPCKNSPAGCRESYWIEDRSRHEAKCPYRPRPCPFSNRSQIMCQWSGLRAMIRSHMRKAHGHHGTVYSFRAFFSLEDFNLAVWEERIYHVQVLFVEHEIFELHKVFDKRNTCLWGLLRHILARDSSTQFSYTIRFQPVNLRPSISFKNDAVGASENLDKAFALGKRFNLHLDCFTQNPIDMFTVQIKIQPRDKNK